ncbi:unnamed protein product, partial [Meganyctiphanes norvegica]
MFEGIVAKLLTQALGTYIEDLNADKLNVSIWGGDVALTNLVIKQSALDELDLGFRVVFGHIGRLTLKIPWKNLMEGQWIAKVEDIVLIANPKTSVRYDKEEEKKLQQEAKKAKLKQLEDDQEKEKNTATKRYRDPNFFRRPLLLLLKNIANVQNVNTFCKAVQLIQGGGMHIFANFQNLCIILRQSNILSSSNRKSLPLRANNEMIEVAACNEPMDLHYPQEVKVHGPRGRHHIAYERRSMRRRIQTRFVARITTRNRYTSDVLYLIIATYPQLPDTFLIRTHMPGLVDDKNFNGTNDAYGISMGRLTHTGRIRESHNLASWRSRF